MNAQVFNKNKNIHDQDNKITILFEESGKIFQARRLKRLDDLK